MPQNSGKVVTSSQVPAVVQSALHALNQQGEAAWWVVNGNAEELTLGATGLAVETVTDVLDSVWKIVGAVMARAEQIREQELAERGDGPPLRMLDDALVDLHYGHDGVMMARHLLAGGRTDLLQIEQVE